MFPTRARTQTARSGVERTNHESPRLPSFTLDKLIDFFVFGSTSQLYIGALAMKHVA